MNLTSRIESLVKSGVCPITFGISEGGKPIVHADQHVKTSSGQSKMTHQCVAESYADALECLQKAADVCSQLQSKILKIKEN